VHSERDSFHYPTTTIASTTEASGTAATAAASQSSSSSSSSPKIDIESIFAKAGKKALGGGKAGALAAVVQVMSLMWLRTSMNYQYRYGGTLQTSLQALWNEGGIPRLVI